MENKNIITIGMVFLIVILVVVGFVQVNNVKELKEINNDVEKQYQERIYILQEEHEKKIAGMSAIDYAPTLLEVNEVIKNNDIENAIYNDTTFNCVEYSNNLVRAFKDEKIYACAAELWFDDGGAHANVVINTSDRGIIYIEPQDDTIIYELNVGDDYCDKVNWNCDWEITHIKHCYF